ncbi:MAG: DUF4147 domain-containing protein [Pseudomonadota bacterium]
MSTELKEIALSCFNAGLAAADPYKAVANALRGRPTHVKGRLVFVALGKAAGPMMKAALDWATPQQAILVTNPENKSNLKNVTCLIGDHPTPSERGEIAAAEVETCLAKATQDDLILLLLSGGASALVPAPKAPLTLADKVFINDQMLASGMPIEEVNTVRRALSRLKGGGFLAAALPARVETLILSDVPSDDPRFIASGPTVPRSLDEDAEAILKSYGLFDRLASRVKAAISEPVQPAPPNKHIHIVGSNSQSVRAMLDAVPDGASLTHMTPPITGYVDDVADGIADLARSAKQGRVVYLGGGEPTVVVKGDGKGGRSQQLTLKVAQLLVGLDRDWVFLAAGTDGRDGPTDAAGAIVDPQSLARIKAKNLDPVVELENNNAYAALAASKDLLVTGGTGTNVGDLYVLILGDTVL